MKTLTAIRLTSMVTLCFVVISCTSSIKRELPTVSYETKETYISTYISDGGRKIPVYADAIEQDPRYQSIVEQVNEEVDRALMFHPGRKKLGYVHVFNARKREILWNRYDIDWHPNTVFNPNIAVD